MADTAAEPDRDAPISSIRERGKAERRRRVIEAAGSMVEAGGIEALSMRALSVESGVSVPTIYDLIGGRDAVLAAVLGQLGTVFDDAVAASSADPLERCFEVADHLVITMTDHASIARAIIAEGLVPMLSQGHAAPFKRYGLALFSALSAACARGDLEESAEPALIVDQAVSLTAVRFFRWATNDLDTDPDGRKLRAAVTHGVGLLLAGSVSGPAIERVRARVVAAQAALLAGPAT
jgi:AcrR family transcriptional regulator